MNKLNLLLLLFVFSFIACKKDNTPPKIPVGQSKITELKNWYQSHKKLTGGLQSRDSGEYILPVQIPIWDSTNYYPIDKTYTTPLEIDVNGNTRTTRSLVLKTDELGNVISGEYTFIMLTNAPDNLTMEQLLASYPKVFDFANMPNNFKASMLKYNLDGEITFSKHFDNQVITETNEKIKSTERASSSGTEICIDHWWVEWNTNTGVIISITFLGSDCFTTMTTEGNGGAGGGSSGTINTNSTCIMTTQQAQAAGAAITGEAFDDIVYINGVTVVEEGTNITYKHVNMVWKFYSLDYHVNNNIKNFGFKYSSLKYKLNTNDPWMWAVVDEGVYYSSGSTPTCFTTLCVATSSSPTYSSDRNTATTHVNYLITTSIICSGAPIPILPIIGSKTGEALAN